MSQEFEHYKETHRGYAPRPPASHVRWAAASNRGLVGDHEQRAGRAYAPIRAALAMPRTPQTHWAHKAAWPIAIIDQRNAPAKKARHERREKRAHDTHGGELRV